MMGYEDLIIYEIYPAAFITDTKSAIKNIENQLEYIAKIGFTAIWLTPIFASPFKDSGYDTSSYTELNWQFGTIEEFKEFLEAAKKQGIKIILDIALNHTSDEHPWFQASKCSKKPYEDFYYWKDGQLGGPPNNWKCQKINDITWKYSQTRKQYYLHIYSDFQPDLNWSNPLVIKELAAALIYWLKLGVYGFRLDVINKIAKDSKFPQLENGETAEKYYVNQPEVYQYLEQLRTYIDEKIPTEYFLLGQVEGVTVELAHQFLTPNKKRLDGLLEFSAVNARKGKDYQKRPFSLSEVLINYNKWQKFNPDFQQVVFTSSHDLPRLASRYQRGNKYDENIAKALAVYILLFKAIPIVYFGDELGVENAKFPTIAEYNDIRSQEIYHKRIQNESEDMVFKDIQLFGRENARFPVNFTSYDENNYYKLYQFSLSLRKKYQNYLFSGVLTFIETPQYIGYRYKYNKESLCILVNVGATPKIIAASAYILKSNERVTEWEPYEIIVMKGETECENLFN
ncbi:MAG: alpha-amylase family glycosyl hydrolase [Culicoidibacterales bacterium]